MNFIQLIMLTNYFSNDSDNLTKRTPDYSITSPSKHNQDLSGSCNIEELCFKVRKKNVINSAIPTQMR